MANPKFDIYVVAGYPERLPQLQAQLDEPLTVIQAPTGDGWREEAAWPDGQERAPDVRPPSPFWRDTINPKLISNGEMNCMLGHFRAWQAAAFGTRPAVILEDDARLVGQLPDAESLLDNVIYYLGYQPLDAEWGNPESPTWAAPPPLWWTIGYMVSPHTAQALVVAARSMRHWIPSDEFFLHLVGRVTEDRLGLIAGQSCVVKEQREWTALAHRPPIVEPRGWPSQTDRADDPAFKLRVIVMATEPERIQAYLDDLRGNKGFAVDVVGAGEPGWDTSGEGGRQKLDWLVRHFESRRQARGQIAEYDEEIWLVLDGYDTEITGSPLDVLTAYGGLRWPCVISGESTLWPHRDDGRAARLEEIARRPYLDDDIDDLGGNAGAPYNYPCSGAFIGPAHTMVTQIDRALQAWPDEQDDQALMQRVVLNHPTYWRIDAAALLMQNMNHAEAHIEDPERLNKVTGSRPIVWHKNGGSKFPWESEADRAATAALKAGKPPPATHYPTTDQLWGRAVKLIPVSGKDMWLMPLLSCETAAGLAAALNGLDAAQWAPLKNDDVPGDEYRGPLLDPLREWLEPAIARLNDMLIPARIGGIKDIFAIRHGLGQVSLPLHTDISHMSGSIKLQDAEAGGELWFPRQAWSDRQQPVGSMVWWPSAITHPHTTLEVAAGTRLAITVWTNR